MSSYAQQEQADSATRLDHSAKARSRANTAMWLSLIGLLCFPTSIAGFVLGLVSLANFRHASDKTGKNKAIIGIILGGLPLLSLFGLIFASLIENNPPSTLPMKILAFMGVMSGLLLSAFGVGAVFAGAVIVIKRKLEKTFLRVAERSALRNPWNAAAKARRAIFSPYFPYASIVSLILAAALAALTPQSLEVLRKFKHIFNGFDFEAVQIISISAQLITLPLAMTIMGLHYSGIVSRKVKYELIFSYALSAYFLTTYGLIIFRMLLENLQISPVVIFFELLFWWVPFLVVQPLAYRFSNRVANTPSFGAWFFRFQSYAWWFLALILWPLFVLYCLVRFHLVNIASCRPILYFRSFELKHAPKSFGGIVAKSARRYGIIEALMTQRQRGSDLQAPLELTDQARFVVADEASWRSWVVDKLSSASLVIADVTDSTGGSVDWEIQQSISSLGPSRVAVLYSGAEPPKRENVWYLKYDLSRRGIKRARLELSNWLKTAVLEAGTRGEISAAALETRSRSWLRTGAWAVALTGVLSCGAYYVFNQNAASFESLPASIPLTTNGALRVGNFNFVEQRGGPARASDFKPGDTVQISYEIAGSEIGADGRVDVGIETTLVDGLGTNVSRTDATRFHEPLRAGERINIWFGVTLLPSAPTGDYQLDIKLYDAVAKTGLSFKPQFRLNQ